jgi:hypothetical protein
LRTIYVFSGAQENRGPIRIGSTRDIDRDLARHRKQTGLALEVYFNARANDASALVRLVKDALGSFAIGDQWLGVIPRRAAQEILRQSLRSGIRLHYDRNPDEHWLFA